VSLKQTSICVVDRSGSVVREGVVDSDPEAISVYVRSKAPGAVRIGLETGPTSTWLWTELKRFGLPVICIDARHAKAVLKMQINKSDRNDAIGIARIMQTGWFKEVHVKDIDSHSVRALLASRALLVKIKRDLENPCSRPSEEPRSRHLPRHVQCLRRTSRGVDRGSSRFGGCSQAAARSAPSRRAAGR
jgi:transposase